MVGGDSTTLTAATNATTASSPMKQNAARSKAKRQMRDEHSAVSVSNATNSRSPNDLRSRIFIGNLNTSLVTKRHLHVLFANYGDIKAISMHKGYAFVQYGCEMDALNAVIAQDQQILSGQAIDVNSVLEPKPHQRACKKAGGDDSSTGQNETNETGQTNNNGSSVNGDTDVDCSNDVDASSRGASSLLGEIDDISNCNHHDELINGKQCHSLKSPTGSDRQEFCINADEDSTTTSVGDDKQLLNSSTSDIVVTTMSYSQATTPQRADEPSASKRSRLEYATHLQPQLDVLICGNCRTLFTSLTNFLQHKKVSKCRLRFVCHCSQGQVPATASPTTASATATNHSTMSSTSTVNNNESQT